MQVCKAARFLTGFDAHRFPSLVPNTGIVQRRCQKHLRPPVGRFIFCCNWETLLNRLPSSLSPIQCRSGSIHFRNSQPRCSETLECKDVCRLRNGGFLPPHPLFPILSEVRRLNLKRGLLLCCCRNTVRRLMTACQQRFAC